MKRTLLAILLLGVLDTADATRFHTAALRLAAEALQADRHHPDADELLALMGWLLTTHLDEPELGLRVFALLVREYPRGTTGQVVRQVEAIPGQSP